MKIDETVVSWPHCSSGEAHVLKFLAYTKPDDDKHHLGLKQRTENFHRQRKVIWTITHFRDYDYLV